MKRALTLLLALTLCLGLAACHQYLPEGNGEPVTPVETPDAEPELPADDHPELLRIDALNVEFVAGVRDIDELLALKSEFPKALIAAMKKGNVEVGEVTVTFGTSDDATAEALRSGAVDIAFLSVETTLESQFNTVAVERYDAPDLALTAVALNTERLSAVDALHAGLPDLAPALTHYTGVGQGGVFIPYDEDMLTNFFRLYSTGESVLHSEAVTVGDLDLTLNGVGRRVNDYAWGIRAIEIRGGDTLLQTIEMTEAANDPNGGLDEYTSCPEPDRLFRAVDVNFDGYADIEVFGWMPSNTIPYFYWLWNPETQQYEYSFRLQGPTIDPSSRTLTAEYHESAAAYYKDVYKWQDGALVLVSHEQVTE